MEWNEIEWDHSVPLMYSVNDREGGSAVISLVTKQPDWSKLYLYISRTQTNNSEPRVRTYIISVQSDSKYIAIKSNQRNDCNLIKTPTNIV